LQSLLDICGFDDITFHNLPQNRVTLKPRLGSLLRGPLLAQNKLRHRLFGVNQGGQFGTELIVTARRKRLFDPKYK